MRIVLPATIALIAVSAPARRTARLPVDSPMAFEEARADQSRETPLPVSGRSWRAISKPNSPCGASM